MTLKELKERCDEANIAYQYGMIEEDTQPPYLMGVVSDSNNFIADNRVYKKIDSVELHYVFKTKNVEIEETIEQNILGDVAWRKSDETFYIDEGVWEVIYYFNI